MFTLTLADMGLGELHGYEVEEVSNCPRCESDTRLYYLDVPEDVIAWKCKNSGCMHVTTVRLSECTRLNSVED